MTPKIPLLLVVAAVTSVQFYSDGTNFGAAAALPYRVTWAGATAGGHAITARAFDDLGGSLTSAPVQISCIFQVN